ncbi:MAG: dienelactone hydrolase family protein, partial [Chloroflexi bacterium]|nr:dienelactone hydrolase family protein [Chloroflexota bacterium]
MADILASITRRVGICLVLAVCSGCTVVLPWAVPSTPMLPTSASATDVGIDDGVGVVERPEATQVVNVSDPVIGDLYEPTQRSGLLPAVLVLNGSEGYDRESYPGGLHDLARHLAAQGFVTLALCYFGCPGRPLELRQIALEYVLSGVRYLKTLAEVDSANVSVWGWSRGGELALLVGSYSQEVRSVIAVYGAPWAFNGAGSRDANADCAWTFENRCLPYMMRIPVERIQGPVLLLVGQYDAVWPMSYSEQVSAELDALHHPHQLTEFADVGHGFGSLNCLIGAEHCRPIPEFSSAAWDASAYVTASRVTFLQTVTLLRSLATEHPIQLPTTVPRPVPLPPASGAPSPTPAAAPGTMLLEDALDDGGRGLLPKTSDEPGRYTRGYDSGEYFIRLLAGSTLFGSQSTQVETALPGRYADASLSIAVRLIDPTDDQYVNLGCRSQDPTYQYRLTVWPASNLFQLVRWTASTVWTLTGIQSSSAIQAGSQTNVLELNCHGPLIDATINGQLVASVTDYTFAEGQ